MKHSWLPIVALIALMLSSCGPKAESSNDPSPAPSTPGATGKLTIAVIPKGSTHEFWKSVNAGAQEAGKELGVEIIWKGPLKEDDRESQIKVVEDFITRKVSGIVLAPLDDTALRMPAESAIKGGIPVVIIDSDLKDVETVSFVATDNEKGGEMAGERMAELLGQKGRVVMLRYQEGSASTAFRESGFLKAIAKYPEIKVVSENQYAGATSESAQKAGENLLSPLKGADGTLGIDGIYTPNESSTFGMLRVLQDSGWAGKVKFVGFDASPKLIEGLTAGQIHGLIVQNPHKMGYLGVKTMVSHLKGEKVEKRIDTGATLVTAENMKDGEIAKLIAPPQE